MASMQASRASSGEITPARKASTRLQASSIHGAGIDADGSPSMAGAARRRVPATGPVGTLPNVKTGDLTTPALVVGRRPAGEPIWPRCPAPCPGARLRPHVKAHKCTRAGRPPGRPRPPRHSPARPWPRWRAWPRPASATTSSWPTRWSDATRLGALVRRGARVTVAVDSEETIDAAASAGVPEVLIDVNVGLPRCGCLPEDAGRLADRARRQGLEVRGVMGYEGHLVGPGRPGGADRDARGVHGPPPPGPPPGRRRRSSRRAGRAPTTSTSWATEIQAGSYALMDTAYGKLGLPFAQALIGAGHRDLGVDRVGGGRLRPQGPGHGPR